MLVASTTSPSVSPNASDDEDEQVVQEMEQDDVFFDDEAELCAYHI